MYFYIEGRVVALGREILVVLNKLTRFKKQGKAKMKEGKEKMRMNDRLRNYGLETAEMGGGGDCFFKSIAPRTGMSHSKVRQGVANQLRNHASVYDKLRNFEDRRIRSFLR